MRLIVSTFRLATVVGGARVMDSPRIETERLEVFPLSSEEAAALSDDRELVAQLLG
jgi:hypothetical protein